MAGRYCEQCGTEVPGGSRFCPGCGASAPAAPTDGAPRSGRRWRRVAVAALGLCAVLAGGAVAAYIVLDDDPEDHAVSLVPPDAAFYATVFLEPSLGQKRAIKDVLERSEAAGLQGADEDALERLVEDAVEDGTDLDYERDVEPILGDQIAVFGRRSQGDGASGEMDGAMLLATSDAKAAVRSLERVFHDEYGVGSWREEDGWDLVRRKHRGRPYALAVSPYDASDDVGFTVVDGFAVVGTEAGLLAALDASEGESLADSEHFADMRDELTTDAVVFAYGRQEQLAQSDYLTDSSDWLLRALTDADIAAGTAAMTVRADDGGLVLDVASTSADVRPQHFDGISQFVASLPSDSVMALGFGDAGEALREAIEEGSNDAITDLEETLGDEGLDLGGDLGSWLGHAGMYVAGESVDSVEGGLVMETRSQSSSDAAIGEVQGLIEDESSYDDYSGVSPSDDGLGFDVSDEDGTLAVRGDDDRVVAAMGAAGVDTDAALEVAGGFGDSPAYRSAVGALGGGFEPFLVIDGPGAEQLISDAVADAGYTSEYEDEVAPWLRSVATVAGGIRTDGDGLRIRLVVGLRDDASSLSGE